MTEADAAVIPLDVARQWLVWLDNGDQAKVRRDLTRLVSDGRPTPGPPTSVDPAIHTR